MARALLHAQEQGSGSRERGSGIGNQGSGLDIALVGDVGTQLLRLVIALLSIVAAAGCHRAPVIDNSQHAPAIQRILNSSPAWVDRDKLRSTLWKAEREFYQSRQNLPAWIEGDQASPRVAALIDALKHSEDHGLDPARYGTSGFQKTIQAADANKGRYELAKIPELDTRLTYAYLRYAADLLGWSGNPKAIYSTWITADNKLDLP